MALAKKNVVIIVTVVVIALLLCCLAAVVVIWNLYAWGGGDTIEIPDVVGMRVAEARDAISIRTEIIIVSDDGEPGTVVAQSHEPGTKTHHDDIVRLEVAGPLAVPDLIGIDVRDAWQACYDAGFDDMDYEYEPQATEPQGTVVAQDPEPGAKSDTGEIAFTIAGEDPYPEY